ncbi:hypothetical protein HZS_2759 [Henneguya salminicola]|nr:hypothetical protein HZS_2759 [Henneguya salminicola]
MKTNCKISRKEVFMHDRIGLDGSMFNPHKIHANHRACVSVTKMNSYDSGFIYNGFNDWKNSSSGSTTYFVCSKRDKIKCEGRLKGKGNSFTITKEHSCTDTVSYHVE